MNDMDGFLLPVNNDTNQVHSKTRLQKVIKQVLDRNWYMYLYLNLPNQYIEFIKNFFDKNS